MRLGVLAALVLFTISVAAGTSHAQCEWTWADGGQLVSGRTESAMAYDSVRGRLLLVGGYAAGNTLSGNTYDYDGASWRAITPAGTRPTRAGHAMAFDTQRGVLVLFGGINDQGALSNATYEYDGTVWRIVSPTVSPSARRWHAMVYDSTRHVVVLYGGRSAGGVLSDTWEYDGTTWTNRAVSGPGQRCRLVMVYDQATQRTVVVGGDTEVAGSGRIASGTWGWNGTAWTLVTSTGPLRMRAAGAYSPARQRVVLMGGDNGAAVMGDTWELTPGGWQQVSTMPAGTSRADSSLVYFPPLGVLAAAGGVDSMGGLLQQTKLLSPGGGLSVQAQPGTQQVPVGQTAVFSASANGPVSGWQWSRGGTPLTDGGRVSGATTATLTISGVLDSDSGPYSVVATSACGVLTGGPAHLSVVAACGTSDFNGDGDFGTDQDIETFFACLGGNCCANCYSGGSDFNGDGDYGTDQDIESFFRVLAGGNC